VTLEEKLDFVCDYAEVGDISSKQAGNSWLRYNFSYKGKYYHITASGERIWVGCRPYGWFYIGEEQCSLESYGIINGTAVEDDDQDRTKGQLRVVANILRLGLNHPEELVAKSKGINEQLVIAREIRELITSIQSIGFEVSYSKESECFTVKHKSLSLSLTKENYKTFLSEIEELSSLAAVAAVQ